MSNNAQQTERKSTYSLAVQSLGGVDARAERIRNRRLFATPKKLGQPRAFPLPTVELAEVDTTLWPKVGKIERREGTTVFIWMFDKAKETRRGMRIGNIDRSLPPVLAEIDTDEFHRSASYRKEFFKLVGMNNYDGMSIGGRNIVYYDTSDKIVEIFTTRALDHRVRGANFCKGDFNGGVLYTPGSGSASDEHDENIPESFSTDGVLSKEWDATNVAEERSAVFNTALAAGKSRKVPEFETFLEVARAENPNTTLDEAEEAYENLKNLVKDAEETDTPMDEVCEVYARLVSEGLEESGAEAEHEIEGESE